ncbi:MAG: ATP-dependent helicase [Clostridiaceae bacterium]
MTQEEFSKKHLDQLNLQQQTAVQTVEGATLLLAVPGSGKTTVLVTRLGYMVYCQGIDPASILTMTYTVAATAEMKSRFTKQFGPEYAAALEFRTINGLSAKIIDYYSRNHGRSKPFQLLTDGSEVARMVSRIHQKITEEFATPSTVQDICTAITFIKNMMLTHEEIKALDLDIPRLSEIFDEYCAELLSRKLMDYDDQMKYALDILEKRPKVLSHFQDQYRYLCVDESQDTSKIQHAIISLLAKKYGNLFMVGDEDQSIYGFRGAYPEALLNFSREHQDAKVLLIEQNYRSTDEIVAAANDFVAKNRFRHEKIILPTRGSGEMVQIIEALDRQGQYKYLFAVARDCDCETAVLFRNNDSALPLIDLLDRSNIPYRCRQFDGSFFTHSVVSDLTDIINFAYDPGDGEIFMRIYRKFSSPITKIAATYACQQSAITGKTILEELMGYPELKGYAKEGVSDLASLLSLILQSNGETAVKQIKLSGYGYYVDTKGLDAGKIDIMMMLGKGQATPRDLLNRLGELQDIIQNHDNTNSAQLILSTIHSSKGLEYDQVYLIDIFDGILPSKAVPDQASKEEVREYEEARRLFYVGMTRAKNRLHLFRCPSNEAAFIQEVVNALPKEHMADDSIFAAFPEKLCGKSYAHKSKGKGRVIAQNGQLLLVEYENAELDLLTFFELHGARQVIRLKDGKTKSDLRKKSSRGNCKPNPNSNQNPKVLIDQLKSGVGVTHTKFGEGIVLHNDGIKVNIRFIGTGKVKKFAIQTLAEQALIKVT